MGLDFTNFTNFSDFVFFIKTGPGWEMWKNRDHHRNPREKLHRMGWVPIDFFCFKKSMIFWHVSVRFSLLNHHISSPGTSENHRKTCSERSWRYGYDPVHIAYPSTRNTSGNRRSFFPKICYFFTKCPEQSFAWNGFSGLIREISRIRSENPFQAN